MHVCLETCACLSEKRYMSVWKGVHVYLERILKVVYACLKKNHVYLERGSRLSEKDFMSVCKEVYVCLEKR